MIATEIYKEIMKQGSYKEDLNLVEKLESVQGACHVWSVYLNPGFVEI